MAKELGKDANGEQKHLHGKDYVGDALGQFSLNTITILTGQLTYFYTEKIGMAAATAASIILISKIVDAVTDLVMGKIVDKTQSKHGKARPWLLRMIVPAVIAIIALFAMPQGKSNSFMFGYGLTTNIFASAVCYTAIAVPFYTLIAYTTKSNEEKGKMGTWRAAVGYCVGIMIGIGLIPITNMLGGDQRAWLIVISVMAIISGITLFITFKTSKERYAENEKAQEKEDNVSILDGLKILVNNKYWIKITIVFVCMNIMYAMVMAAPVFYALYVMGDDNYIALINTVNIIPSVLGFMTTGMIIKKFGLVKTARIASVIGILGSLVRCLAPGNLAVTLVFGSVVMYATIPLIAVAPALILNTSEINYKNHGVRITGMTNSANSFVQKIGAGVGSALIGWVLAIGGSARMAEITPNAFIYSVYTLNIYIPLTMFVIMLIVLAKYDFDDIYESLVAENNAREQEIKVIN